VIYIPTRGRVDKQKTYHRLPQSVKDYAVLVCPPDEVEEHNSRGRNAVACEAVGIAATRDWIIEHAIENGIWHLMMLDDDMILQRRREDGRITNCDDQEMLDAIQWVYNSLGDYAHVGLGTRFLGYNEPGEHVNTTRMMYALAYDVRVITSVGATFCKGMPQPSTMEDFNMTLQLLKAGYDNCVSLEWRITPGQSNAPGGCSLWRTTPVQSRSAVALAALHPGLVTVRPKKEWRDMEDGMMDVRVKWKQALGHG
jgi:hypothetical protein